MPHKWQTTKPPNEQTVEVEDDGEIIRVEAFYGRDGHYPHWRSDDGSMWSPDAFRRWRKIAARPGGDPHEQ